MNLTKWNPMRDFDDLFSDYRSLFGRLGYPEITSSDLQWRPATDISETKKAYVVKAQLPDVKREDVSVTVDNGMLKIEGKREWKKEEDDEKQHRTESFYGTFARSFSLPEDVDVSKIRAETKDGVLTVRLPKSKADKSEPKKIEVG